jgi:hypothetical protein
MNAKQELLAVIEKSGKALLWADIVTYEDKYAEKGPTHYFLYPSYTDAEYNAFLESIDFEYDEGYGSQELFGDVGLDGAWLEREEYDGSERWALKQRPKAPRRP